MRWLTRRLLNVIEASNWRNCIWRHRHRRLTIVIGVITVVVTILLLDSRTRLTASNQPQFDFNGPTLFLPYPSDSSSLPSSSSSSSSPSSPISSSLSSFFSVFLAHQLLQQRNQTPRNQHPSNSSSLSSSSSSSEAQPPFTSDASSRSSSALPASLQALDEQSIRDTRHNASSGIKYYNCTPGSSTPPPPAIHPAEGRSSAPTWQRVEVLSSRGQTIVSHLFSAHYDPRSRPPSVLIVGLTSNFYQFFADSSSDGMLATQYFCQFRYLNNSTYEATTAAFSFSTETHGRRYAASFHTCYLRHDRIPYSVSLVTDRCQASPSNELRVQFTQMPSQPPQRNFTVCVTPLNKAYNNPKQLVEMIEVNRMFGAQRFVFYNHTTGTDILPYLRSYQEDGLVEVIPWQLPVTSDPWPDDPKIVPEVHYYGQLAALNDCLYRNMLVSRFVVFTDLDELVVPRGGHATWAEVLEAATRKELGNPPFDRTQAFPGAYVIQNTFFRSDWGDDSRASRDPVVRELNLRTLLKTNRETTIYPWYSRSKCIVWTKAVFTVGIHAVTGFIDDHRVVAVRVDAADALVHHYRLTMWPDDPKNPPRPTHDRNMHRFYDEVTNRTLSRLRQRRDPTVS